MSIRMPLWLVSRSLALPLGASRTSASKDESDNPVVWAKHLEASGANVPEASFPSAVSRGNNDFSILCSPTSPGVPGTPRNLRRPGLLHTCGHPRSEATSPDPSSGVPHPWDAGSYLPIALGPYFCCFFL